MVILKEIGLPHQNFNCRKKEQIEHLFLFFAHFYIHSENVCYNNE